MSLTKDPSKLVGERIKDLRDGIAWVYIGMKARSVALSRDTLEGKSVYITGTLNISANNSSCICSNSTKYKDALY